MYEELNCFEEALKHFGTRVEVICAMELGGRITAEDAYQMVKQELKEVKKALAFAARQERPMVCGVIAEMIGRIESLKSTDEILDKLESREEGSSGSWGQFFTDD